LFSPRRRHGFFFALLKKFFLSLDACLFGCATKEKTAYAQPAPPPITVIVFLSFDFYLPFDYSTPRAAQKKRKSCDYEKKMTSEE